MSTHLVYHVDEGLSGIPGEVISQSSFVRNVCLNMGDGFVREGGRASQVSVGRRADIKEDG